MSRDDSNLIHRCSVNMIFFTIKNESMITNWFFLIVFVLVIISFLILVIKKNHRDEKELFKKMPGDLPDPPIVKSEFDTDDK